MKRKKLIKGFIARSLNYRGLAFYENKPVREDRYKMWDRSWSGGEVISLNEDLFPEITWQSDPKKAVYDTTTKIVSQL